VSRSAEPAAAEAAEAEPTFVETGFQPFAAASPASAAVVPPDAPAAAHGTHPAPGGKPSTAAPSAPADPRPAPAPVAAPVPAPAPTPAPAAEKPAPWARSLTSDEAEEAGFTFLFKHERKPGRDGR
jgi:hypothetical protein